MSVIKQSFMYLLKIDTLPNWINYISLGYFFFGTITSTILIYGIKATYGRYNKEAFFPSLTLNPRLAWMLQEMPSFLIPCYLIITRFGKYNFYSLFVTLLFVVHYFQRSIIYPILMKSKNPVPIEIFLSAFTFCTINGIIQGFSHLLYINYDCENVFSISTFLGLLFFSSGMFINIEADHILRNLRKKDETGYKIPIGGAFKYITCANYFGEIVEWIGFFIVAKSLPSLAFAFFTIANIGPRALQHHQWYLQKFDDYPKNRKALIPFVL